ncbi:hypothetical protein GGF32_006534 [Allomyces javanicus]|nr:hypothetical protein GGF32_006534 [Allomyces javanicus]
MTGFMNVGLWAPRADVDESVLDLLNEGAVTGGECQPFVRACERIVCAVAHAAGVQHGTRILDCGYGLGDQCLLLATKFGCDVIGLTKSPVQAAVARNRVAALDLSNRVVLAEGDAVTIDTAWPALAPCPDWMPDVVLSIDSAYHYQTRARFFAAAHAALTSSSSSPVRPGRLALADLIVPSTFATRTLFSWIPALPVANLGSIDDFVHQLDHAGFEAIEVQDVTDAVFPGLTTYLCAFPGAWKWRVAGWMWWAFWKALGARYVIVSATVKSSV